MGIAAIILLLGCVFLLLIGTNAKAQTPDINRLRNTTLWAASLWALLVFVHGISQNMRARLWLQTLTGNWSTDIASQLVPLSAHPGFEFSVLSTLALVINFSALYFLFEIARRLLVVERRVTVRLSDIFRLRDRAIKNRIINSFPEEQREEVRSIVNDAFNRGTIFWAERHLKTVLGDEGSKDMIERLNTQIPQRKVA